MSDFTGSDEYMEKFKKRVEDFLRPRPFLTKLAACIIIHYYPMTDIETSARFSPWVFERELDSWVMDMESLYVLFVGEGHELLPVYWETIYLVSAFLSTHTNKKDRRIGKDEILEAIRLIRLFTTKDKLKSFIEGGLG